MLSGEMGRQSPICAPSLLAEATSFYLMSFIGIIEP